ncbi:response regulator [Rhodobacteraceae bacterium KN286]|uniref:Response regulator n=1 Tax=Oceanomicrobium pacificus TaxID=2692916 RepID=A0A6B0U1C3_9RHOB|nr:response regulator [Oceanomicrobium pacificus]
MGKRILIVEDEPHIAESLSFILDRAGYDVAALDDGAQALDQIRKSSPDLIILDVMLPNRSGFDILRDLRAGGPHAGLPVLMLTAKGQARDRSAAEDLGASRFMTKPFSNAEILDTVSELMAGG